MLKFLLIAINAAILAGIPGYVQAAGTIPGFSLTPQFDTTAKPAAGCKLYVYQAGTTATLQNSYFDSALTLPQPNPLTCDATGRLPQFFLADGQIKLRLTTANGSPIFTGDNLLVIGPSSGGGGGGGSVDPTTIIATGDMKLAYSTGVLTGFVRCNGRTIGNATSGATERANADTSALFSFLYSADPNLAVSGGRSGNAAADYAANKTIALPDCAGRALAGLDDMGAGAKGRLTSTYFGTSPTVLGAASTFQESRTLITNNLPAYTPSGSVSQVTGTGPVQGGGNTGGSIVTTGFGYGTNSGGPSTIALTLSSQTITMNAQGGTSAPLSVIQPTLLTTIYIKL